MKKRIVICADGTWNKPEVDLNKDHPTNVLKLARAISPISANNIPQQVFYDWGVGSYYNSVIGGATGSGLHKNIMDDYRYIVQNYNDGDELYLFGFSRGAYTIRSLCGLINNCGILTREKAHLIQQAFDHYKNDHIDFNPKGIESINFRKANSHQDKTIKFVGVWDTVGAMGIPISFLGLFDDKDEFYDTKLGSNIKIARHALAIDEHRQDFLPTIWHLRENLDLKQVWFCGAHSNVGGSYAPDDDGGLLSDIPLKWMLEQANESGLAIEQHLLNNVKPKVTASLTESRRSFYRVKSKVYRPLKPENIDTILGIHQTVKERWDSDPTYRPKNLIEFVNKYNWPTSLEQ